MTFRTADIVSLAAIGVTVIASVLVYGALPDAMPIHWNAAGEVDGWLPKSWGVVVLPLAALLCWGVSRWASGRVAGTDSSGKLEVALDVLQVATVLFMSAVAGLVLMAGVGAGDYTGRLLPIGVGILFITIGFVLGRVNRNRYIGIRTPWTAASEVVWRRTHRVGGWCFAIGGLYLAASNFLNLEGFDLTGLVFVVLIVGVVPIAYSWIVYRQLGLHATSSE